jgi:hypothetical protein
MGAPAIAQGCRLAVADGATDATAALHAAPSQKIVIRGCRMRAVHGGVTIGSEVSSSVLDVFVERTEMSSPDLDRGIRFKTNAVRGDVLENVFVRDVEIGETGSAIDIDMQYEKGVNGSCLPVVRNILFERLAVHQARYAFYVRGLRAAPVQGLVVKDSSFDNVSHRSVLEHVEDLLIHNVSIRPAAEPASTTDAPQPSDSP